MSENLNALLTEIRACRICEGVLGQEPRPILRVSKTARLLIVSQAPGVRAHNSNLTFNDPSGDRLRSWLGIDRATFYDERKIAIVPMGFCFPGYDSEGHDRPPRKECAATWRTRLFAALPRFPLTLLVGSYAQAWHLKDRAKRTMSETVEAWHDYTPRVLPLPHPSWRNNAWIARHPFFEAELLPWLRRRVRALVAT